jgi:tRNA pseudouridine38-40 synthase
MPRVKLTIAYEGTLFHGWQKQALPPDAPEGSEPARTVQEELERAVRHVVREPIVLMGASRTDAGVHAVGQVAAFTTSREIPLEKLALAINARLPDDMQVLKAESVVDAFDPISDCTAKGYRYRIHHPGPHQSVLSLFERRLVHECRHALDPARMHEAAIHLVGKHDFTSFTLLNHGRETTVRTIFDCRVSAPAPDRCEIDVSGSGFLHNMVRIIAGTLIEVGRGRIEPGAIPGILAARDRRQAGPTAPPNGLCLMWVRYRNEPQSD